MVDRRCHGFRLFARSLRAGSTASSAPLLNRHKSAVDVLEQFADAELVEAFETLLCKMTGLASSHVFCSSLEGQGVPKGSNFVDHSDK